MKSLGIMNAALVLSILGSAACSSGEQTLDKRQSKSGLAAANIAAAAAASQQKTGNGDAQADTSKSAASNELQSLSFPAIKLASSAGAGAAFSLINKISATDFVLHTGKASMVYHAGDALADVKALEPQVVVPTGSTLYSLPDNEFWLVSADSLYRRKAVDAATAADSKTVPVEQFATSLLPGDTKKLKVLYAAKDELIVSLDTFVAILAIKDGKPYLNSIELAKLSFDLKGDLQAGRLENGGYWFRSASGLYLLMPPEAGKDFVWKKADLSFDPAVSGQLAMWLDSDALKASGNVIGIDASGNIVSDYAAPAK